MKYSIGDHQFKTKTQSYRFVKTIIDDLGCCEISKDHPKYGFLCSLTRSKPHMFELSLNKCSDKYIHMDLIFKVLGTNTKQSISWVKCSRFIWTETTQTEQLTSAYRVAIQPHVSAFYIRNIHKRYCAKCATTCDLQVDHIVPFSCIKDMFNSKNTPPTQFSKNDKFQHIFTPDDSEFTKKWITHHNGIAKYQLLCGSCNRLKSNRVNGKRWVSANRKRYNEYHRLRRLNINKKKIELI